MWLDTGTILDEVNNTTIVLIPKKNSPVNMKEIRPIALCNVIYKIVAKVLANRLQLILPEIFDETQSGFVADRMITNNIIIPNEVVHWLKGKLKGAYGVATMKIDVAKAYDQLEWDYLEGIMRALGFCDGWIDLVILCVRTVKFNVFVGEEIVGPNCSKERPAPR